MKWAWISKNPCKILYFLFFFFCWKEKRVIIIKFSEFDKLSDVFFIAELLKIWENSPQMLNSIIKEKYVN